MTTRIAVMFELSDTDRKNVMTASTVLAHIRDELKDSGLYRQTEIDTLDDAVGILGNILDGKAFADD